MFQTNPNSNNNNNEDATRPVVARATHLAKLATYPDFTDAAAEEDEGITETERDIRAAREIE